MSIATPSQPANTDVPALPIVTHRPHIRLWWAAVVASPWALLSYQDTLSGSVLPFTLRKFFDTPVLITFLLNINTLFNLLVGVFAGYWSDRIWTRFGRRKPFLATAWIGSGITLLLIPLAPSAVTLIIGIVLYQFFVDLARPWEPLYNEVVPPLQRGRAQMFRMMIIYVIMFAYQNYVFGMFDHTYDLRPYGIAYTMPGELFVYATGSVFAIYGLLVLAFIKETPSPNQPPRPQKQTVSLKAMFVDLFGERKAWLIYMLYLCPVLSYVGVGSVVGFYQNEQLGFTKEEMGDAAAFGLPFTIFVFTPIAGLLADRLPRLRLLQMGLILPAIIHYLAFFVWARIIDFDMGWWPFALSGLFAGAFGAFIPILWGMVVFDYIPSSKLGTYTAGFTAVSSVVGFFFGSLAGVWVQGFTYVFGQAGPSQYDWSSAYILNLILSGVAVWVVAWFRRQEQLGRIAPEGRLEMERLREAERLARSN